MYKSRGRAISYKAQLLWNSLPITVQDSDTVSVFKPRLKKIIIDKLLCAQRTSS